MGTTRNVQQKKLLPSKFVQLLFHIHFSSWVDSGLCRFTHGTFKMDRPRMSRFSAKDGWNRNIANLHLVDFHWVDFCLNVAKLAPSMLLGQQWPT